MKILLIHNQYAKLSGEEVVVKSIENVLRQNDHDVSCYFRSSAELEKMPFGKTRAFFSGIYSFYSRKALKILLSTKQPDIIHIHNLYPLISPSILTECREAGIPVIMTVHNYRLICPNGLFMVRGRICEKCAGGNEYWCIFKNCEGSLFKSTGYALRNWFARMNNFYVNAVSIYVCLTNFQKGKMVKEGFPEDRIEIIPNIADIKEPAAYVQKGDYVGFAGRVSPEKGLPTLMKAASANKNITFKVAGSYDRMPELLNQAPPNLEFVGYLEKEDMNTFFASSRMIVLPTKCYEGFPTTLLESMLCGKPIICSKIGGLPEIVDNEKTGLLFEPGNADELSDKIKYLWENTDLCSRMGDAGREKVLKEYSPRNYYKLLMSAYSKALHDNQN